MSDGQTLVFSGRREYGPQRQSLMDLVCPERACSHCGEPEADMIKRNEQLEFDHQGTRNYLPSRLNRFQRLRMYHREWAAWVQAGRPPGIGVVGACPSCNQRLGGGRAQGTYDNRARRRRARPGKGYASRGSFAAQQARHYRDLAEREREAGEPPF